MGRGLLTGGSLAGGNASHPFVKFVRGESLILYPVVTCVFCNTYWPPEATLTSRRDGAVRASGRKYVLFRCAPVGATPGQVSNYLCLQWAERLTRVL